MANGETLQEVVRRVKDFNRRIRDLEEKVRNLNARVNTVEDTLLERTKKLNSELSDVNDDVASLQDRAANLEVDINNVQRNMRKMVSKREISEIENYLDLMDPVNSSFVTESEVEDIVEEKASGGVSKYEVNRMIERKMDELKEELGEGE
ncbi:MAG: hypothetical protein SVQ76_01280 [Candidatus Nanohaloarchaea archaeon]|nr:hypothetical protein [Candidatus Nanohaloarchaea archaeon]